MLWKKELIKNRNPVYVNLFHENEFLSNLNRFFEDLESDEQGKTVAKDDEVSDAACGIALRMKKRKENPEEILLQINKTICFAEIDGEKIALAYGLRAEFFDELKQYSLSLADIELAKRHKYPAELSSRLDRLKSECLKKLARRSTPQTDVPKLSFPMDAKVPCFAEGLEVKHTKKYGKHIVATRDLKVGQTVIIEDAFCMAPQVDQNYLQCANCYERNVNLIPCNKCSAIMFCSQKCYDEGHSEFHAFECGKRDVCNVWESAPRLVLRTVIRALKVFPIIEDLMAIIENFNNGKANNAINYADPAIRAYIRFFWLSKSVEHTPTLLDMEFVHFTKTIHSIIATSPEYRTVFGSLEESRFLAHLILHHFSVVDANEFAALSLLHGIHTTELGLADSENPGGFVYAHGIYLNSCQLNHSCQPNLARIFMGSKLVGKVIRPIKSGQQLFVSYLDPLDLLDPAMYRKEILEKAFYFECKCKSCAFDLPPFKSSGKVNLDHSIRRLLSVFGASPNNDAWKKRLVVNRGELLKFEKSAIEYLHNNDNLYPTSEALVIQFLLMQIWNNLGR